jgi:HD-GYP domain-containing protein (c-di-GMP phosphodiesterase class II)
MAGLLHDIGKVMVPQEILNKPGRLEPAEWAKMKDHSVYGAEALLRGTQITDSVIRYVLVAFEHHLTLDLEGYPSLNDRRDLSLFSRIVAIADCFDALTTPRPYRSIRYQPHEALSIMMEGTGTLFDPVLLKFFVNAIGVHPIGTVVQLESGDLGVVIRPNTNPKDMDKPVVRIFRGIDGRDLPVHLKDLAERDPAGNLRHRIVSTGTAGEFFESIDDYIDML